MTIPMSLLQCKPCTNVTLVHISRTALLFLIGIDQLVYNVPCVFLLIFHTNFGFLAHKFHTFSHKNALSSKQLPL